jgi:hypothetical protein
MTSLASGATRTLRRCRMIDLSAHFDNNGVSRAGRTAEGAFNIWANTFPAEELPPSGGTVMVGGIPFRFPDKVDGRPDNLRCAGQLLALPPSRCDWIYLLAAAERRSEDWVWLHYRSGAVEPEWLRVSDFWPETAARFGELAAFRCTRMHYPRHVQHGMGPTIWRQRVPVPREEALAALRLPDNPAIHLFAMTLALTAAAEAGR